ncbi:hypothetical protein EF879_06815 [Micromonospora sp. HM5-17]|nr:hypothetical protein EF879_06815 [Micromonospora sp. HM5-17]
MARRPVGGLAWRLPPARHAVTPVRGRTDHGGVGSWPDRRATGDDGARMAIRPMPERLPVVLPVGGARAQCGCPHTAAI